MARELDRDLGLLALITISVGAMLGPGLFVLPGLATGMAGEAVWLAYLLAGLLALPAALSKAELATAMPGSGGPYLYLDRALGPMIGTVAGLGAWLSLIFKAAFALIGLGAYLALVAPLGAGGLKLVALVVAGLLVALNTLGAKETGRLQIAIVAGVLAAIAALLVQGVIRLPELGPLSVVPGEAGGVFAATGFVFVSFIGIMKIASIAEEVEDPDRNLPLGIIISLAIVILLYPLLTGLMVAALPVGALEASITPMADLAGALTSAGGPLVLVVTLAAIAALVSMANAGLLAASRFPFALSRDDLAPEGVSHVSERLGTPVVSVLLSGVVLLVLIASLPVAKLAKLASGFLLLIFAAINGAVIVLREGSTDWYDPSFQSPWYPWTQTVGILAGVGLLTQMGLLPVAGTVGLIVGGLAYYRFYARGRTAREGVGVDTLRRRGKQQKVEQTAQRLDDGEGDLVMIPIGGPVSRERQALLLRIADDLVAERGGRIQIVRFEEVPEQIGLGYAAEIEPARSLGFANQAAALADDLQAPVEVREVVTRDMVHALQAWVDREGVDLVLADTLFGPRGDRPFSHELDEVLREVACDVAILQPNQGIDEVLSVALTSTGPPFDPAKLRIADAVASRAGAPILLVHAMGIEASDAHLATIRGYHEDISELASVPTKSIVLREEDPLGALLRTVEAADLVVVGADPPRRFRGGLAQDRASRIAEMVPSATLIVRSEGRRRPPLATRLAERILY